MNYRIFLSVVLLGLLSATCGTKSDMVTSQINTDTVQLDNNLDKETQFTAASIESQATFGGVKSNLKGTRKYELNFEVIVPKTIEITRLLIDSIAIPFSALLVNGEKRKGFVLSADTKLAKLAAYRNLYSSDASTPQIVKVIEYDKTGLNLGNKAWVEYQKNGKLYYVELDEIKRKQDIYAP